MLMEHEVVRNYFQGKLYDRYGKRLKGISIGRLLAAPLELDEVNTGRLFMIPVESSVWTHIVRERDGAPAGLDVMSNNFFMAEDEYASVIAYRDEVGAALGVDALHIRRMMLAPDAPKRLATVAFGLMAIAAYRHGFACIVLYAAGKGPIDRSDPDGFVGYLVWPKFGFDAPVAAVELNRAPCSALRACKTVQDLMSVHPDWWADHGSAREMRFDLRAGSRSWRILLNYLCNVLPSPENEP